MIRDPLYGMINIPSLCRLFIDCDEFERLRNIRQLGFCYYVFPSATHTRFEHCIGTCHVAQLVCEQLTEYMSPREKELVYLAAMWHDVGHMACSHLMDSYLEEQKDKDSVSSSDLVEEEEEEQQKSHSVDHTIESSEDLCKHENRSIDALKRVNQKLGYPLSPNEVRMVSKMILGDTSGESKPFLFQIVSNQKYGVDVDRLDYLKRDSYHIGHAGFQADYIIKCIRIENNEIAFDVKAKEELLNMFQTRRRLFRIIYHHKTTCKVEELIKIALNKSGLNVLKKWWKWDDYELICHLRFRCPDIFSKLGKRDFSDVKKIDYKPDKDVDGYMNSIIFVESEKSY